MLVSCAARTDRSDQSDRSFPLHNLLTDISGQINVYLVRYHSKLTCFPEYFTLLFRPGVFCRALGREARRRPARTHGSTLDSGRDSWRVLWGLQPFHDFSSVLGTNYLEIEWFVPQMGLQS